MNWDKVIQQLELSEQAWREQAMNRESGIALTVVAILGALATALRAGNSNP